MKIQSTPKVLAATAVVLALTLCGSLRVAAQSVQYVTINSPSGVTNYAVQPMQLVTLVGYSWAYPGTYPTDVSATMSDGSGIDLTPNGNVTINTYGAVLTSASIGQAATGLTNIVVRGGWATFEIKTPGAQKTTFDYVPADCVVVPTSASGTVNIILESSADLQNWSAAMPGSYNPVGQTNRFFRVRAVGNP